MLSKKDINKTKIYRSMTALRDIPGVTVKCNDFYKVIEVKHHLEFIPDLKMVYCDLKNHYRVYIMVGSTSYAKSNAGYTICTIGSSLSAIGLATVYSFLHKQRAHNRNEA